MALVAAGLLAFSAQALGAKQAVDFFGGAGTIGGQFQDAEGAAVNYSGAGGVPSGTIYVTDGGGFDAAGARGNRIQRFQRDDNGTPADTTDDTYSFVSAWGAGVDGGGSDYEICSVAADCGAGAGIGGNGSLAGNGALSKPTGIAVDQDSGEVYVADSGSRRTPNNNFRINVYGATGAFLRSFGWDVVASGPDDNGTGYEICKAGIDICKAGVPGSGVGQSGARPSGEAAPEGIVVSQPDGNPVTGTVYLGDRFNQRINTYNLDGTSPGSIGSATTFADSQPQALAIDSRGILYASNSTNSNQIERYDTQDANGGGVGFLAPIAADSVTVSGGPGDATGSKHYVVTFTHLLGETNVGELVATDGTTPLSGGSGVSVSTTTPGGPGEDEVQEITVSATAGQFRLSFEGQETTDLFFDTTAGQVREALEQLSSTPPLASGLTAGLVVDPDSDGVGPDTDVLYAVRENGNIVTIRQFGPANPPGLTDPPSAVDETHGTNAAYKHPHAIAIEPPTGRLYVAAGGNTSGNPFGNGVFVFDNEGPAPTASLDSLSNVTATSVTTHATIDPNGPPNTVYHFEYSSDAIKWVSTPTIVLGHQEDAQFVSEVVGSTPPGLHPNTHYYVRLVAGRRFSPQTVTAALEFTTTAASSIVETTGSPVRSATTAQLNGRVNPRNSTTTYHFEYGAQGPCDANPCQSTESRAAGNGDEVKLVAEQLEGLEPNTTYHYRVIAENGHSSGPAIGADMTVTTRASDAPLSHGRFPGPPGSDRAYEQVNLPDTGGNPVKWSQGASDNGDRLFYVVAGGTPVSNSGTLSSLLYAERIETAPHLGGWHSQDIGPPREQLVGGAWEAPVGLPDLSDQVAANIDTVTSASDIWRLRPGQPAVEIFKPENKNGTEINFRVSKDASRVLMDSTESLDPGHPTTSRSWFDVSSGAPHLVGLLPDGSPSPCNVDLSGLSADGSVAYFKTCGDLYARDFDAEQTKLVAPGNVNFIKLTSDAAFFTTTQSLDPDDTGGTDDDTGGTDVYRYDLGDEALECVTCVAGLDMAIAQTAVAQDGSKVYFTSTAALLPGATTPGIYRVDVASGDLAYVASIDSQYQIGEQATSGQALTPDGSALVFTSDAPSLNAIGGQQNGGTLQYYRYDDRDRSLTCLSCPQNGSAPIAAVVSRLVDGNEGTNKTALSADGQTFAFATTTSLLEADQNTFRPGQNPNVGTDVYEWRNGRLLLITDGLTKWSVNSPPVVSAITPSGHDVFFTASYQYTQDALDGYRRIYTARIGGGFEFPPAPKPCPLEVCQGTPKGAPEEQEPGSRNFAGPGNKAAVPSRRPCPKGRHKARKGNKARCVKRQGKRQSKPQRAKHDRRTQR